MVSFKHLWQYLPGWLQCKQLTRNSTPCRTKHSTWWYPISYSKYLIPSPLVHSTYCMYHLQHGPQLLTQATPTASPIAANITTKMAKGSKHMGPPLPVGFLPSYTHPLMETYWRSFFVTGSKPQNSLLYRTIGVLSPEGLQQYTLAPSFSKAVYDVQIQTMKSTFAIVYVVCQLHIHP